MGWYWWVVLIWLAVVAGRGGDIPRRVVGHLTHAKPAGHGRWARLRAAWRGE